MKNKAIKKKKEAKANKPILLSEPHLAGNEWLYIKECLDTNWVSSAGKYVTKFEKKVAKYIGRKHAVACVNGTAALHLALVIARIQPNDEVVVPALTFVAPANAIRYVGAWPVFMDVEASSWQMDPMKLKEFFEKECDFRQGRLINKKTQRVIKAIIPVHILGHPVDMDPILQLARRYNLIVIEDAAEALGARYKKKRVGSFGHIGCFSFNGNKIITTGGGGMIVTDNVQWANRARFLTTQAKDDPIENIHSEIGFNYRLTNIQAAMGVAQMEKLNPYIKIKRQITTFYDEALKTIPGLSRPQEAPWARSIMWLYTIVVNPKTYGATSRQLLKEFQRQGIQTRPLWHPLYSLKPFQRCTAYQIEVVDDLYRKALSLPSSVGITKTNMNRIISILKQFPKK